MAKAPAAAAPAPAAAAAEAPKKGKGKLIIILVVVLVVVLAAGGAAAFLLMGKKKHKSADGHAHAEQVDEEEEEEEVPERKPSTFVPLDMFTVNLADEGRERYLQLGLTLELTDLKAGDEIKKQLPLIRSEMLVLLTTKKSDELLTAEGKKQLQSQMLAITKKPFKGTPTAKQIRQVHFTSFVIQ